MDYIFNRASVDTKFCSVQAVQNELALLLKAMATIDTLQSELPILRIYTDPWSIEVLNREDGSMSLGDVGTSLYEIDYDLGNYFNSLQRMTPPDTDFNGNQVNQVLETEVKSAANGHSACYDRAVIAKDDLILCTLSHDILVSLSRDGYWGIDHLAFRSNGQDFFVDHIADPHQAAVVLDRAKAKTRTALTARAFWEMKEAAFPNLVFGLGIEADLKKFSAKMLNLLFHRLADLDSRTEIWKRTGAFPDDAVPPITGESAQTMAQFGNARRFRDENGDIQLFEEHMWVDRQHRIHLIKDIDARLVKIGYIGTHLPTVKHKT